MRSRSTRTWHQLCLASLLLLGGCGMTPERQTQEEVPLDARIQAAVAAVFESRLEELLRTLVGFGTRNTYSPPGETRGIRAASQWIHDELQRSSPRLQVSFDVHQVPRGSVRGIIEDVEIRNVVAVLPGRSPRRIYVTAHYDSLSRGAGGEGDAPGANDNGSGTVLMMEAARVLAESGIEFDASLVFMATAAEEQGLVGAQLHAARALKEGAIIQGVFNNDIVGGVRDERGEVDASTVRLYSVGPEDSPSRALARFAQRVAARYVPEHHLRLLARSDRLQRSGDHVAFNRAGVAAVGFRESRENYARQHNATDTLEMVSPPYLAQNTRVNVAVVASLALAPVAPIITRLSTSPPWADTVHVEWEPVEGAAGYRLYRREAWGPDWRHEEDLGTATEHVVPRALLDVSVYGIAAIGPDGHESVISAFPVGTSQSPQ